MKNNYGLPGDELDRIFERDSTCVYCHKTMTDHRSIGKRADWHTIEHLNYLPPWNNPATVAICCWSCNSSRGDKRIADWLKTDYCISRNITENTVAGVVKDYIRDIESSESSKLHI